MRTFSYRRDRLADECARNLTITISDQWRRACVGAGACLQVYTVSGVTESTPKIVTVDNARQFTVALPPGMVSDDLRDQAHRLAAGMGMEMLRVTDRGPLQATITLLLTDPLATARMALPVPLSSVTEPLTLGLSEDARTVRLKLATSAHLITQGASGSGKSVGCYNLLGQLVDAPDVIVAGSDITGLLLGPWERHPRHASWQANGTANLAAHVEVLERVVAAMDERIQTLPYGHDQVQVSPDVPLILVTLEEWPGALRVLGQVKGIKGEQSLADRARGAVSRLLAEGRKAGIRVLIIAQRADASVVGGFERGQASHTISYRVDTLSSLKMLHADVDDDIARAHATAAAGVAVASMPGTPLVRLRSPFTTYAAYCELIAAAGTVSGEADTTAAAA